MLITVALNRINKLPRKGEGDILQFLMKLNFNIAYAHLFTTVLGLSCLTFFKSGSIVYKRVAYKNIEIILISTSVSKHNLYFLIKIDN